MNPYELEPSQNDENIDFDERYKAQPIYEVAIEMASFALARVTNREADNTAAFKMRVQGEFSGIAMLPTKGMDLDQVQLIKKTLGGVCAYGDRWNSNLTYAQVLRKPGKPYSDKLFDIMSDQIMFDSGSYEDYQSFIDAYPNAIRQVDDLDEAVHFKQLGYRKVAYEYHPLKGIPLGMVIDTCLANDVIFTLDTGHMRERVKEHGISVAGAPTITVPRWEPEFEAVVSNKNLKKLIHFQGTRGGKKNTREEFIDTVKGGDTVLHNMVSVIADHSNPGQLIIVEMSPNKIAQLTGNVNEDAALAADASLYLRAFKGYQN